MTRIHYGELDLEPGLRNEWESLRERIFELSDYLVNQLKLADTGASFPHRVAYHTSCHGFRELGIQEQPLKLLRAVKGIELVELEDRNLCCGFGGTFSVKFSALSAAMGEDKLESIRRTGATIVTATDDSCLMHLAGLASRRGQELRALHYARILAGEGAE